MRHGRELGLGGLAFKINVSSFLLKVSENNDLFSPGPGLFTKIYSQCWAVQSQYTSYKVQKMYGPYYGFTFSIIKGHESTKLVVP